MIVSAESALRRLEDLGIQVPKGDEIRSYLSQHPDMADAVLSVGELVRGMFPAAVQLMLELYRDPEIDDQYLTLYVRSQEYGPELRQTIREAAERRIPFVRGLSGRLLVTSDFQSPR